MFVHSECFFSKCIFIPYIAGISVILNDCYNKLNKIQMQPSTIYAMIMYVSLLSFQIVFHMPVWTNSPSLGISERTHRSSGTSSEIWL